jgi:hypothetical protein
LLYYKTLLHFLRYFSAIFFKLIVLIYHLKLYITIQKTFIHLTTLYI